MHKKYVVEMLIFLVTFVVCSIPIFFMGSMFFIDEIGTVGNIAQLMGRDLAEFVNREGFFYKYGQALFYAFAFIWTEPVYQIRTMFVINAIMVAIIPVLCYRILSNHFILELNHEISEKKLDRGKVGLKVLISLSVGFLPASMLLSKNLWAESLLFLTTWLTLFVILRALNLRENEKSISFRINSVLISFFSVLAFAAHQRGIVIIIASLLTILIIYWLRKIWLVNWISFGVSFSIFLLLDNRLTIFFREQVLNLMDLQANTFEASANLEFLVTIFSVRGLQVVLRQFVGYMLAISNSTVGLILIAIVLSVVILLKLCLRKIKLEHHELVLILYGMLIFMGALALGILFFYEPVALFYWGVNIARADRLIYSRYIDSVSGPLILFALYVMSCKRDIMTIGTKLTTSIGFVAIIIFSKLFILPRIDNVVVWMHLILPNALFINGTSIERGFVMIENLSWSILVLSVVTLIIMTVFMLVKGRKMLILVVTIFLIVFTIISKNVIIPVNNYYSEITTEIRGALDEMQEDLLESDINTVFLDNQLWRIATRFVLDDGYRIYTERDIVRSALYNVVFITEKCWDFQILYFYDIETLQFHNDVVVERVEFENVELNRIKVYTIRLEEEIK